MNITERKIASLITYNKVIEINNKYDKLKQELIDELIKKGELPEGAAIEIATLIYKGSEFLNERNRYWMQYYERLYENNDSI